MRVFLVIAFLLMTGSATFAQRGPAGGVYIPPAPAPAPTPQTPQPFTPLDDPVNTQIKEPPQPQIAK